jgi:hypothetical protein
LVLHYKNKVTDNQNTNIGKINQRQRELSSQEIEADSKLQNVCLLETLIMECTPVNISLDQDAIKAFAAALSDTIKDNIKNTMEATITKIVDGVVTG